MRKLAATWFLVLGMARLAPAGPPVPAPELDPGTTASELTILAGVLLLRRRSKA
jgi:hypothetical protein